MAERDPAVTIGLIPCAVGGTPLSRWQKGGDLYADAVGRAKLAMEVGTLKGVIWHQGENDAAEEERAKSYGDRLAGAVRDLRIDLGTPELLFVAGQLGEFLYARSGNKSPFARTVNERARPCPGGSRTAPASRRPAWATRATSSTSPPPPSASSAGGSPPKCSGFRRARASDG